MSRCDVVGAEKPLVWRDDEGWVCDQAVICRTCRSVSMDRLAEDVPWEEAVRAATRARPVGWGDGDKSG